MTLVNTVMGLQRGLRASGNPSVIERNTTVFIYELDNDDELVEFVSMEREEILEKLNLYEEDNPYPGELYHRYIVSVTLDCLIVIDEASYNM